MKTWSYGITTVPSRVSSTFEKTLESLTKAGFDKPYLFIDGAKNQEAKELYGKLDLEFTSRYPALEAFGNWIVSLWELYLRNPHAHRYAIFQDDFITYKNLREYLDKTHFPNNGYLNLYTFPENQKLAPENKTGFYPSNQLGRSAVALVFNNKGVVQLLQHQHIVLKPKAAKRPTSSIDGAVVEVLKSKGFTEYVHNPSLVQHIGDVSAIGNHHHPKAISFKGEEFDALEMLPETLPKQKKGLGDKLESALTAVGITHERVENWLGRPCNCRERKRKLNQLGMWVERVLSGRVEQAEQNLNLIIGEQNKNEKSADNI